MSMASRLHWARMRAELKSGWPCSGLVVGGLGLLALAGCGVASDAVALNGASQPAAYNGAITIASDPAGARCAVLNGETVLGEVAATPGTVSVPRGLTSYRVRCTAPGRMETVVALRPERDFGVHHPRPIGTGIIQNAAVMRSGSTQRYPDITVHLPPERFASTAARDAWFTARAEALRAATATRVERANRAPDANIYTADIERQRGEEDLAALTAQQNAAQLGGS